MGATTFAVQGDAVERWLEWLGDLATYRPSDFLMFSARTYGRLFELHNAAWWPLPLVLPALGVALLAWQWRGGEAARRAGGVALAAAAGFVGGAFVLDRYAAINWAAKGLVVPWAVLCLSLLVLATRGPMRSDAATGRRTTAGVLALWALLGHPWMAPLAGRPWAQVEVFGLAPDPTVLAVFAWLLAGEVGTARPLRWTRRIAWACALGLGLASAATLAVLGEWQAVVPALAVGVACLVLMRGRGAEGSTAR